MASPKKISDINNAMGSGNGLMSFILKTYLAIPRLS